MGVFSRTGVSTLNFVFKHEFHFIRTSRLSCSPKAAVMQIIRFFFPGRPKTACACNITYQVPAVRPLLHGQQCRINHVADVANATGVRPQGGPPEVEKFFSARH